MADIADRTQDFGANSWLVEEMYEQFRNDPTSVSDAWREFFSDYKSMLGNGASNGATTSPAPVAPAAAPTTAPTVAPAAPAAAPKTAAPAPSPVAADVTPEPIRGAGAEAVDDGAIAAVDHGPPGDPVE